MDLVLFNRDEYDRLYNCTGFDAGTKPLEDRRHVFLGIVFLVIFFGFEILYVPSLFFFSKRLDIASYKYMLYIGVCDILSLTINGLTGILGIVGAVFCDSPGVIFGAGILADVWWFQGTTVACILAFSRTVETVSPTLGRCLFHVRRAWYWTILPTLYGLYFGLTDKPIIFSGVYFFWFYNPFQGYSNTYDAEYNAGMQHSIHNYFVAFGLAAIYVCFIISFKIKHSIYTKDQTGELFQSRNSLQNRAFTQVLVISVLTASTSLFYILMQYMPPSQTILVIAQLCSLIMNGQFSHYCDCEPFLQQSTASLVAS
ncbi:SRT-53 protein [Aphelenchoides avenae]|nr:SRT-53 protein [Aphelenchus avenae]